jgi:hypothetical protein
MATGCTWAGAFSNIDSSAKNYLALYKLPFTPDTVQVSGPTASCMGETALYTATTGISGVSYHWRKNGVIVGTSTPTYSYVPASGDVITCTIIPPTGGCYTADSGISSPLNITVPALIVPTITLAVPSGALPGETVTVNATVAGTGGSFAIKWYVNGTLSGTTSAPVFSFTKGAGTEDIKATVVPLAAYCYDTGISALVQVRDVTGVHNMAGGRKITVYPNPSTAKFIISKLLPGDNVQVYDLNGKVQFQSGDVTTAKDNATINLASLAPGCYFLSLSDKDGNAVLRTVIQKE